jgi:hypothetical protein
MVRIIRKDFRDALVDDHVLDCLISSNRLLAFHRSNEWVVVGRDAVREQYTLYPDEERRKIILGNDFCMK